MSMGERGRVEGSNRKAGGGGREKGEAKSLGGKKGGIWPE